MAKTWLITGCSSGFGLELAKIALKAGDNVAAASRDKSRLSGLVEEFGDKVLPLSIDVTDAKSAQAGVDSVIEWTGTVDVLVNNAGFGNLASVEETSLENYKQMYDVNVFGVVHMIKSVLPHMRKEKSGNILNISSVAGITSMPGLGVYCSTKFAVEGITEALAQEVSGFGIKVTAIEPGGFRTKFMANIASDEKIEEYNPVIDPMREMLKQMEEGAPGDPVKAAQAMYEIANMEKPPMRILLGSDALKWANDKADMLKEQINAYKEITTGTDFS